MHGWLLSARRLFDSSLVLESLPKGAIKYCSMQYADKNLPAEVMGLIRRMAEGISDPRVSYNRRDLCEGELFGHGRWHRDGREQADEIHRLFTLGGTPTEGEGGQILHPGTVWEYSGRFEHRARPAVQSCQRLMLRISQTSMPYRNHWQNLW